MQLSAGSWTIIGLAVCSSIAIALWPVPTRPGQTFWLFALDHDLIYHPAIATWNRQHPNPAEHVTDYVISGGPLARRLASGFLSGTPVPDMCEVETGMIANFFSGPLDAVGFRDLTDRIHQEGLDQKINAASFSPWTNRGHIFGLPHDVHPVLLAYRADLRRLDRIAPSRNAVGCAGTGVDGVDAPDMVKKIAWAGDGKRGSMRLELGAGALAGGTLLVQAEEGRVRVELNAPPGRTWMRGKGASRSGSSSEASRSMRWSLRKQPRLAPASFARLRLALRCVLRAWTLLRALLAQSLA